MAKCSFASSPPRPRLRSPRSRLPLLRRGSGCAFAHHHDISTDDVPADITALDGSPHHRAATCRVLGGFVEWTIVRQGRLHGRQHLRPIDVRHRGPILRQRRSKRVQRRARIRTGLSGELGRRSGQHPSRLRRSADGRPGVRRPRSATSIPSRARTSRRRSFLVGRSAARISSPSRGPARPPSTFRGPCRRRPRWTSPRTRAARPSTTRVD